VQLTKAQKHPRAHPHLMGFSAQPEIAAFLLGPDTGLTALKHLILEKTEGTSFFMEEVVQTLTEEGALVGERGHFHLRSLKKWPRA
jgi:hypothetical protein